MRFAFVAIAACLSLALPGAAVAKPKKAAAKKKDDKKKAPDSAEAMYRSISGTMQPLPKPTELSLHFEVDVTDAAAYTVEAAPAAAAVTKPADGIAWTVADWRKQIALDLKWLVYYRKLLAAEVRKSQRDHFVVAEHYLTGLFDSTDQFLRLAQQDAQQFNADMPADRDAEVMTDPPAASRRVRLYRDRALTLYGSAKSFVARTVAEKQEKIVRLDAK